MRKYLSHNELGHLVLVMADLFDGQHERTEFHVVYGDGTRVRGHADLAGKPVTGDSASGYRFAGNVTGAPVELRLEAGERSETTRTACCAGRGQCEECIAGSRAIIANALT